MVVEETGRAGGIRYRGEAADAVIAARCVVIGVGDVLIVMLAGEVLLDQPVEGVIVVGDLDILGIRALGQIAGLVIFVLDRAAVRTDLLGDLAEAVIGIGRGVAVLIGDRGQIVGVVIGPPADAIKGVGEAMRSFVYRKYTLSPEFIHCPRNSFALSGCFILSFEIFY